MSDVQHVFYGSGSVRSEAVIYHGQVGCKELPALLAFTVHLVATEIECDF